MGDNAPQHPGYKKMKDTPWIKQGRRIASAGGSGILDNYNNVNVFDQGTRDSLEARNNAIYQRAFNDMNRNYNDIMNSYASRNYNRFGSLNNTPASYTTDEYNRDFQRQMNDLSYNKAMNYENLINNELNRRYKTLDMFGNMYGYGETPYKQDVSNWNIENTNRDIEYKNAMANYQNSFGTKLSNAATGAFLNTFFPQEGYINNAMSNFEKFGKGIGSIFGGKV